MCRSPPHTACACAGRAPAGPAAPVARSSQDGEEVERAVERSLGQAEVALRDGRGEAVVERLRDAQSLVHRVPAEVPDRQLVQTQLARVEQAEQLDTIEGPLAQLPELLGPVLLDVPRVVGL